MDPNACLAEILEIAKHSSQDLLDRELSPALDRISELVEALDGWIAGGGFLPARWARK